MSIVLGGVSPMGLLFSSCCFMVLQPRRGVKIVVRAMLAAGAWLLSGSGPADLDVAVAPATWADFTPLPDFNQCPVLTSNLSSASSWAMLPMDNRQRNPFEAGLAAQVLEVAAKPETIMCLLVAAALKATHDLWK